MLCDGKKRSGNIFVYHNLQLFLYYTNNNNKWHQGLFGYSDVAYGSGEGMGMVGDSIKVLLRFWSYPLASTSHDHKCLWLISVEKETDCNLGVFALTSQPSQDLSRYQNCGAQWCCIACKSLRHQKYTINFDFVLTRASAIKKKNTAKGR